MNRSTLDQLCIAIESNMVFTLLLNSFLLTNLTLSSIFIPHCHSFNSHFKFFTFILTHASLRMILSFEGDEVYKDR